MLANYVHWWCPANSWASGLLAICASQHHSLARRQSAVQVAMPAAAAKESERSGPLSLVISLQSNERHR